MPRPGEIDVTATTKPTNADNLRINEKKWSKTLMDAGWTVIPSVIIERQAALGLDSVDMNIIIHLAQYWWTADRLPSPAVPTIAKAIGLKTRAVQKRLRRLEALKFIECHPRPLASKNNDTNLYSFQGLIAAATPFAQEALVTRAKAVEAKKKRLESKKPKLVVDNAAK
jgi:hypothetical protein